MIGTALKILIADDDEGDRKQIKRAVQQAGLPWQWVETDSTEKAIAICEQTDFDCVIFDYHLPGLDGLEGISAIHERFPYLPIIMSTGQGDESVATNAMKRGASDYIRKVSFSAPSIHRMIENAIEKSRLQRKIRQQQDDLEVFARVLAHDLSSPAAAIHTFATRIAERLATGQPEKALEYADWVIQTADRMTRLIETLHRYTTADAKVPFEPVDMNRVLDAALANLDELIHESGSSVSAAELPVIFGNAPQLIQLLQNLIGNAIKYCDNLPTIRLEASKSDEAHWQICVIDNGIGVPEGQLKRIFEPFVRVKSTSNRKGSGLGLATCKKIVERHQGNIWCHSKPGSGATFTFTLPAATVPRDDTEQSAPTHDLTAAREHP